MAIKRLFTNFNEHIKQNTDQNVPIKNNSSKILKNIIKDAIPEKPTHLKSFCSENINNFYFNLNTLNQYIPVFSPPPKV